MGRYDNRLSARQRGYTRRWEKARAVYLREHPLCVMCSAQGRVTAATVVDHKIPHRGDQALFWDQSNWQSLCKPHHDATKQAEERQGFSAEMGSDGWPLDPAHPANTGKMPVVIGTVKSHPYWFRKSYVPLTIVCGAPGSGKTTYVNNHAGPQDRIICFDLIATALFGKHGVRTHAMLDSRMVGDVLRERNEQLADLMRASARTKWPAAWLIVGEPRPERRQWWQDKLEPCSMVVMRTPAEVCKARVMHDAARGDERHASVSQSIDEWWSQYRHRDGDAVVEPDGTPQGGVKSL